MSDFVIRRVHSDEAKAFATLRREMLTSEPLAFAGSPEQDDASHPGIVRERLREEGTVMLGAFGADGSLLGSMILRREPARKSQHKVHVFATFVRPEHRRRGIAAAMMGEAIRVARAMRGLEWLLLSVSSAAPHAQRLYESAGFEVWGREPDALHHEGESADEIHMTLRIAGSS
ncbi:MAG: GNAT family N-acetyltransferase [Deltaproteobacteria bacterium]|nr:GNAT family N-acetyltransferase [Deltaproteobacteria bacterium]MBW2447766.1 GNAT family N-acetyltransferase [Deltaproteobacteria bacterium]